MYNPYQQPGSYGRPPDYAGFPGAPPGMAPPPGMAAPGTGAPPGIQQVDAHQPGRVPAGFPPNFQPPMNMPNINFSAPVIRLGTSGAPKTEGYGGRDDRDRGGRRAGLGAGANLDSERRGDRDRIVQIQPSTKDEIIRTIFVGGITEGAGGDEGIERILRAAGNLRRWTRATDADDKPCKFGFAEYEDPESLSTAIEVLKDVEVRLKRPHSSEVKSEGKSDDGEATDVKKSKLLIVVDENSLSFIQQWEDSHGGQDPSQTEMRLDYARSALSSVLVDLDNPSAPIPKDELSKIDRDGDIHMADGVAIDGSSADIVTIPITVDDELSDIPAEMRETVAKEISAFRDRSNRRDLERLKREEEIESQERNRMANGSRHSRLSSPPASAPSGPAGGANGIPVGPRDRNALNAPSGPKGFGTQIPRDYQRGVAFVSGTGTISGASAFDDEDTDASDSELERRRREKKEAEFEKHYLDQERRWLNRERSRTAAVEREKTRDNDEASRADEEKVAMARRLKEWDDDAEVSRKVEEYYADRSMWIRSRAAFKARETALDEADRNAERAEARRERQRRAQAEGLANDFLDRQAEEMETRQEEETVKEPARFKLSLGVKAREAQQASVQSKKANLASEVEGLLEDEEEEENSNQQRKLIPIQFDSVAEAAGLTDEERAQAAAQLARDIPTNTEGLWKWPVKWEYVDDAIITEQLKPFVEKKIMDYLGVQEQMLVDVVEAHLRKRGEPGELVGELEGALDQEAEALVKKLWRMLIFYSESENRGLSA